MNRLSKLIPLLLFTFFLIPTNVFAEEVVPTYGRGVYSDGSSIFRTANQRLYQQSNNPLYQEISWNDPFILGAEYVFGYNIPANVNSINGIAYIPVCVNNGVDRVGQYNRATQADFKAGFNANWFTYNQNVVVNSFEKWNECTIGCANSYQSIFYCTTYIVGFTINNNNISGGTNFSFGIVPSSAGTLTFQPISNRSFVQDFPVKYWANNLENVNARVIFTGSTQTDPAIDEINQNTQTIISQNNQINNNITNVNNNITDETGVSNNDISDFLEDLPLISFGPVSTLIQIPIRLITDAVSIFGSNVCSGPLNLGTLYGTAITLPCINIRNYVGNTIYNTFDLIFAVFILYNTFMMIVHFVESWTTLKDGFSSIYNTGGGK